jgi:corrinoid protein of di/trimethylamine methyltransferase
MDSLGKLNDAIRNYDEMASIASAQTALAEGLEPLVILDTITKALTEIGDLFSEGELFLPDLIGAAAAATPILPIIEEELKKRGLSSNKSGTVVIGTVRGDIHDIGKSMVGALLTAHGFKVIDLGTDVPVEKFIQAVSENQANILALSSLLTTTASEQKKVIEALKTAGLRDQVKILVGGGAINAGFAQSIGADGYGETASDGVKLARSVLGIV